MKSFTIKNAETCVPKEGNMPIDLREFEITGPEEMDVSDGYHTMSELYDHRITLFVALCRLIGQDNNSRHVAQGSGPEIWRSKLHSDGSCFEDYFVMGIGKKPGDMITYHLPMNRWKESEFAETLERAPMWDGHTSEDVINRLKNL